MKFKNKIKVLKSIILYHLFNRRIPLYVYIKLTHKCNLQCKYCMSKLNYNYYLSKEEVFRLLDELKKSGTIKIIFSGGEALLRPDIEEIIQFAIKKGFEVFIKTNGVLIPPRIKQLKGVSKIILSFNGPEKIHDSLRGKGSFKKLIKAIEACNKNKIPIGFNTLVFKNNLDQINFMLEMAKRYNTKINFFPLQNAQGKEEQIKKIMPSKKEFKYFFKKLIENKKYKKYIANSKQDLKYLAFHKGLKNKKCYAGILCCSVSVDGAIFACPLLEENNSSIFNIKNISFKSAFQNLPKTKCKRYFTCWVPRF